MATTIPMTLEIQATNRLDVPSYPRFSNIRAPVYAADTLRFSHFGAPKAENSSAESRVRLKVQLAMEESRWTLSSMLSWIALSSCSCDLESFQMEIV